MRRVPVVVALALSLLSVPLPAAASVWDPNDVDGPLDIRSVSVLPLRHDRLNLTISFWAPFRRSAISDGFGEGVRVRFYYFRRLNYYTNTYLLRRSGSIVLWHGDRGSASCCYRSRVTWLARRTLTTSFLPWWVRKKLGPDLETSHGMRYRARSRVCREPCIRDHTGWGVVP